MACDKLRTPRGRGACQETERGLAVRQRVACLGIPARYTGYTMEFEFDPAKSAANKAKHGIDFVRAQALWDDPDVIEIPARTSDEPRWVIVGRIGNAYWSAIIARREERLRIISVRRSRREEVSWVEGEGS